MTLLIIGLILFFGIHLMPLLAYDTNLRERLGFNAYRGIFSLVSVIGFALMIIGYKQIPYEALWISPGWTRHVVYLVMPVAVIIFMAKYHKTRLRRVIKHPMLTATLLWASVHLLVNGDLRSTIIFAAFGLYALIDMVFSNKSVTSRPGVAHSLDPDLVQKDQTATLKNDLILIASGLTMTVILMFLHPYLSGVALFG